MITKTEKYTVCHEDGAYYNEIEVHEDSVTIGSPEHEPVEVRYEDIPELIEVGDAL